MRRIFWVVVLLLVPLMVHSQAELTQILQDLQNSYDLVESGLTKLEAGLQKSEVGLARVEMAQQKLGGDLAKAETLLDDLQNTLIEYQTKTQNKISRLEDRTAGLLIYSIGSTIVAAIGILIILLAK